MGGGEALAEVAARGVAELLVGATAVIDDEVVRDAWVAISAGQISAVGSGREPRPAAGVHRDLRGATVLPGFIDLHVHGGGGHAFGADDDASGTDPGCPLPRPVPTRARSSRTQRFP